jgi:hypothetical protein
MGKNGKISGTSFLLRCFCRRRRSVGRAKRGLQMLKNQSTPSDRAYSQVNLDQLLSEVIALRERAKALEVGQMLGRKVHSRTESAQALSRSHNTRKAR